MPIVAVTYSPVAGGSSVISLKESFKEVGSTVVDADYRAMMADVPADEFKKLYDTPAGRQKLFAHAKAKAAELLSNVDCLALSGNSAMIDPDLFNKERETGQKYDFSRTLAELALVHIAIEKGMPILGVCGGHQVIAVHGGGEIANLNAEQFDKQNYMNYDAVRITKDSMLANILGGKNLITDVHTPHYEGEFFGAHNQVVKSLGKGFKQTAIASDDHSNEAAESEIGAPILTTQFHPEIGAKGFPNAPKFVYKRSEQDIKSNLKIFEYLNDAAKTYSQKKPMEEALRKFKPEATNANIKPSQVKAAQQELFKENADTSSVTPSIAVAEKKSPPSPNWLSIALSYVVNVVGAAVNWVGSILRKRIASHESDPILNKLRKKEEQVKIETPPSSFPGIRNQLHSANKSPDELLNETPAKIWTKQDDDVPVSDAKGIASEKKAKANCQGNSEEEDPESAYRRLNH